MITATDKNPAYEKCGWFRIFVLAVICAMLLIAKCAMAEEVEHVVQNVDGAVVTLDNGDQYLVDDPSAFPVGSTVAVSTDDSGNPEAVTDEQTEVIQNP